ncbi:YdiU family protein [Aquabacterium lacunae]|uniref:Protein nucleotidyltransferase YdiU n=1 Tax=Aquabacterium lacunae TaxID=2528630 RepID=A0A4Q9H1V0_9BURK|nr:YdiU family protein [Aquabacterium lacunae]TBO33958.1 YdiU family protein [Aquabacterium lacunae]
MSEFHEGLRWPNRYLQWAETAQALHGPRLIHRQGGEPLEGLHWVAHSANAAASLGWPADWWESVGPEGRHALEVFAGHACWPGMAPCATVYSGHQFGQWAGQLGDGRALLLGEVASPQGPQEIQLKGAGQTPYSRRGDGRAVLRSSVREFLCSEAMHALGIPTSRALCLVGASTRVARETVETAAVVTRVAPSFVRFGHFEHLAHHPQPGHLAALAALVDFVVEEHLPALAHLPKASTSPERPLALLRYAAESTARLMAQWQAVGFCHGVMNTDNMSILGLTIDYGPFGFMDAFDPDHICNHSDHAGRYRWRYQPDIGFWNCGALAQALAALVPDAAQDQSDGQLALLDALRHYEAVYETAMTERWCAKLGLHTVQPGDADLAQRWLKLMAGQKADFTIAFRRLSKFRPDLAPDAPDNAVVRDLFLDRRAFDAWANDYSARLALQAESQALRAARMDAVNPWVVLRNHLAQQAIDLAQRGDFSEVHRLHTLLQDPYTERPEGVRDADFPPDWAAAIAVSCSS